MLGVSLQVYEASSAIIIPPTYCHVLDSKMCTKLVQGWQFLSSMSQHMLGAPRYNKIEQNPHCKRQNVCPVLVCGPPKRFHHKTF